MKVFLLILGFVSSSWAQSCDSSFGGYLQALKDETNSDDQKVKDLETENRDDYLKLIHQCFGTQKDDTSKCALTDDELQGDVYGESGPMKGCARCQGLAKGLRDKYLKSPESVRQCFRKDFAQAVREELEPCIQGKISNGYQFKVPIIPDFDEKTFKQIGVVETAVDYRIMARSRLDVCQQVDSTSGKAKSKNTINCMNKGFPGIYAKHCQAAKNARAKAVSAQCSSRFGEVKTATCQCMEEKRQDWHDRFAKIQDIVNNAKSASECGNKISDVIGSWLSKIQSALNECLPKTGDAKQTDLRTLIELGCGQVINGGVKKNELTVGFRFVRLFLDALNDRITIFCDKNCNF